MCNKTFIYIYIYIYIYICYIDIIYNIYVIYVIYIIYTIWDGRKGDPQHKCCGKKNQMFRLSLVRHC